MKAISIPQTLQLQHKRMKDNLCIAKSEQVWNFMGKNEMELPIGCC